MADNLERNLELERILATLANLPNAEAQQSQNQQDEIPFHQCHIDLPNDQHIYTPNQRLPQQRTTDPRLVGRSAPQHPQPTPASQQRSSTPLVDPSTITEWKHGLRCVNKIAAQNQDFAATIRKLMKDQEQNVKAWGAGQTRLIEDQKHKRENEQTHRAALSSTGLLDGAAMLHTPENEKKELDQYIMKVYRASTAMVESQTSTLKTLGVPFFGVQPHLILISEKEAAEPTESSLDEPNGKITKEKLLELQRKMLSHLMDLYGD